MKTKLFLAIFTSIFFAFCKKNVDSIQISADLKKGDEYACTIKTETEKGGAFKNATEKTEESKSEIIKIEQASADSLVIRVVIEDAFLRDKEKKERLEILCSTDRFGNPKHVLNLPDFKTQVSAITSQWQESKAEIEEFERIFTMPKNIIYTHLQELRLFFLLNNKKFSLIHTDTLEDRLKMGCFIVEPKINKTVIAKEGFGGAYTMNLTGFAEIIRSNDAEKYERKKDFEEGTNLTEIETARHVLETMLVNYKYKFSAIYQYPKSDDLPTDIVITESSSMVGGITTSNYKHDIQIKKKK
jgi:hypothetical protein